MTRSEAIRPEAFTLLIVDDLADNRELLCRRFRKQGFQVREADGGAEALAQIRNGDIDLVLLDINMPGMSGIEVLKELRADSKNIDLPVIMATARAQSEHIVEALDLGANDYVTKPIDFPVLKARVVATLRVRQESVGKRTPPPDAKTSVGSVIAGRYELEESIGSGGFGQVYRARHRQLERSVAVKVLHVASLDDHSLARFRREGVNACRVQHPNAVAILDSGVTDTGVAYLVMELLEGNSLQEELRDWTLSSRRALEVVSAVCSALHTAHEIGIVHRDIKPANIFLHGDVPKVLDFGLAKLVGSIVMKQRITLDGWMVGTPLYMAPERFGTERYDGKSDIYSIGVMLHQLLTGKMPFTDETDDPLVVAMMHTNHDPTPLRQHNPKLSEELESLVLECLAKDPLDRPSAQSLAATLLEIAEGLPNSPARSARGTEDLDSLPTLPTLQSEDATGAADYACESDDSEGLDVARTLIAKRVDPPKES